MIEKSSRLSWGIVASLIVLSMGLVSCLGSEPGSKQIEVPVIKDLGDNSLAIGEELQLRARNFATEGNTYVEFDGRYVTDDGQQRPVKFEVPTFVTEAEDTGQQIAKWLRFGPFSNPFTDRQETGHFVGHLRAINEFGDGETIRGPKTERFRIKVEPSIEIESLQPVWAKCGLPALRGFAGIPYRLRVNTLGFVPTKFQFNLTTAPNRKRSEKGYVRKNKKATGPSSMVQGFKFDPVPKGMRYYVASLQIRAKDQATGRWVSTSLPFPIHRPMEVRYDGNLEVAEHYPPQPVTACIPGSIGNRVTYSETETQVRQQTVSIQVSESWTKEEMNSKTASWSQGYGVTNIESQTETRSQSQSTTERNAMKRGQSYNQSEQNSFEYGTRQGERWQVSVGQEVQVGGEASIPGVANVNGSTTSSFGAQRGGSQSESKKWGQTVVEGRSKSVENSYSLANSVSSSRSFTNREARQESKTYNFGAEATYEERVSKGITEAETNTWTKSSAHETLTSYSGFIPVGRFGVFYRQTIRMVRQAQMVSFNACGQSKQMGRMMMNEWKWAPDLAIGNKCGAELPDPNLPPAQCHIPPCK